MAAGSRPHIYFCLQSLPSALTLPRILSKRYETYTPFANRQTPLAASRRKKGFPSLINARNVTQNEIYWFAILQRFLAAPLERFDAFCRNFTVKRQTCSSLAELFI